MLSLSLPSPDCTGSQKGKHAQGEHAAGLFLEMPACPLHGAWKSLGEEEQASGQAQDGRGTGGPGLGQVCRCRRGETFVLGRKGKGGPWGQIKAPGDSLNSYGFTTVLSQKGFNRSQGLLYPESCSSGREMPEVAGGGMRVGEGGHPRPPS